MLDIDEIFSPVPSKIKNPKKYVEITPKKCLNCGGRGLVDKIGEPDVGWGTSETCQVCQGSGKYVK